MPYYAVADDEGGFKYPTPVPDPVPGDDTMTDEELRERVATREAQWRTWNKIKPYLMVGGLIAVLVYLKRR